MMIAGVIATVMTGPFSAHATGRTEQSRYTGIGGWIRVCETPTTGTAMGGGCFTVQPADTTVSITIVDDMGYQIPATYSFTRPETTIGDVTIRETLRQGSFCGSTGPLVIPEGAEALDVGLYPGGVTVSVDGTDVTSAGPNDCDADVTVGTTGAITATFL